MRHITLILFLLLGLTVPALAQDDFPVPYTWNAAGITFLYPASWDTPIPAEESDRLILHMAEALAGTPEIRPPGVPVINFALFDNLDVMPDDLTGFLQSALITLNLQPIGTATPVTFLNVAGQQVAAASADGAFAGAGQVIALDEERVLVVTARGLAAQQGELNTVFALITNSAVLSDDEAAVIDLGVVEGDVDEFAIPELNYGVLWRTIRTVADGDEAFIDLAGLAYAPGDRLYSYDYEQGLVLFDAASGAVTGSFINEVIEEPGWLAADTAGNAYLADISCACVYVFDVSGSWREQPITGFDEFSPYSIAIAPDGRLFGTNEDDEGMIGVRVFQNGAQVADIPLGEDVFLQPTLAVDPAGRVLAITDIGDVFSLEGNTATLIYSLGDMPGTITGVVVDSAGNFVFASPDQGIVIVNSLGETIGQPGAMVVQDPAPGDMVSPNGLALGPDGTLYFADSDGQFGAVTALSDDVPEGRIGSVELVFDLSVQGNLSEAEPEQSWTFAGAAGQRVTISATDTNLTDSFNLTLRLVAPDGAEEAYNAEQASGDLYGLLDPQIANHTLSQTGTYTVVVETLEGFGSYRLSITEVRSFTLAGGSAALTGNLDSALVSQRWEFTGEEGQVLDIVMQVTGGDLDPLVRLIDPAGEIIIEGDYVDGDERGFAVGIEDFELPEAGTFAVEAVRFEGAGSYELSINTRP